MDGAAAEALPMPVMSNAIFSRPVLVGLLVVGAPGCFELPPDKSPVADAGTDAGSSDGGTPQSTDAGVDCRGGSVSSFPAFDRTCVSDDDCTIALHETNCCGSLDVMGIAAAAAAVFAADEALCESMFPGCGCASGAVTTDDGASAPEGSAASAVVVHCVAGACTTSVRPKTSCGGTTCDPTEVCVQECSGIPVSDGGTLPSSCVSVPSGCAGSSDCSCFGSVDPCPTGSCMGVQNGAPFCLCE